MADKEEPLGRRPNGELPSRVLWSALSVAGSASPMTTSQEGGKGEGGLVLSALWLQHVN